MQDAYHHKTCMGLREGPGTTEGTRSAMMVQPLPLRVEAACS
jgi:hypothetical protein